ncbi:MAG: hypothetical protein WDW36_009666 [Sanguina aurantia]
MLSLNEQLGWGGSRSTYVALSSIFTLGLALITSIWHADISGTVALLGLLAVYQTSTEMLLLFTVFTPISVVVDIVRLVAGSHWEHYRGWLIFFTIVEMAIKLAGTLLSYSLYRTLTSGEALYQQAGSAAPFQASNVNPTSVNRGPTADPFTSYAPPAGDLLQGGQVSSSYQPESGHSPFPVSSRV